LTTVLFKFVYGLKQAIYTQLVAICGQQNYTINTKHVIAGVIEEGTRLQKNVTVNRFTTATIELIYTSDRERESG
jgi:hypothetical protein